MPIDLNTEEAMMIILSIITAMQDVRAKKLKGWEETLVAERELAMKIYANFKPYMTPFQIMTIDLMWKVFDHAR